MKRHISEGRIKMPDLQIFDSTMPAWQNAQKPMGDELRWKNNFPHYGQTLLRHANSVPITMVDLLEFFRPFNPSWNEPLLYQAIIFHDHGEPRSGGDEDIESQTEGKAIREWVGFAEMIQDYPESTRKAYLRAFALQYAIKDHVADLPKEALDLVLMHRDLHMEEAWFFEFVECVDYFRSAREGNWRKIRHVQGHEGMFEHVFRNAPKRIEVACDNLPLLTEYWTPQLQVEFAELARIEAILPAFVRRKD
jgi:hypothetical protein